MNNYIDFIILKEKKLIIEYYSGQIFLNDFIRIHNKKSNHKDFNVNYNLLIDFRDAEIFLSKEDILELVDYHKNDKKLFGSRYAAHLTKTPKQVVSGISFDLYNKELPIKINVFSTLESSLDWIDLTISDKSVIQTFLDTLKTQHNNGS